MAPLKPQWWKIILPVITSVLVDVILHRLFAPRIEYAFPPSVFVEKGLFLPAASLALILWFGTLAVVFALIQNNLPGTKATKGWRYGIAFGGLCFLAIIEMSLIFNSPLVDELRTSLADGLSLLLLGLLLGLQTGTSSRDVNRQAKSSRTSFIIIPIFFLIGRYIGYTIFHIMSSYSEKPVGPFLWTLCIGGWAAMSYELLKEANEASRTVHAVRFGFLIFGTYWLIYNLFVLLFVDVSVLDVFVRVMIDVLSVTIGIWVVNRLSRTETPLTG